MEERMSRIPLDEAHCPSIGIRENSLRAVLADDLVPALCNPVHSFFPRYGTKLTGSLSSRP
jgi:hypothetical protein